MFGVKRIWISIQRTRHKSVEINLLSINDSLSGTCVEFDRSESSLSLKIRRRAKRDTINLKRRPRRMLIRLRLCDTTLPYASAVARQQSRIAVTIVQIRGHLIARLTRTTPKTICLGGYHRSALSRPIRHARRLTTCRNRAHSMSLYQFSTYTPGKRVKKEDGKGGDVERQREKVEQEALIHAHTETGRGSAEKPADYQQASMSMERGVRCPWPSATIARDRGVARRCRGKDRDN